MVLVTPVDSGPRRQQQAPEAIVGTAKSSTIWVLGLLTASTVITVAVCMPPPVRKNAYFVLVISCCFFAGVGGVMCAVCKATADISHRQDTGRKVMHVLLDQLGSVVGAAFSTTTALGVLGLSTASTAITVAVCVPPPALHKNAYLPAISCFFFAGVGVVMSAVCKATTTDIRHRQDTGRKVLHVLLDHLGSVVGTAAFSTTTALGVLGLASASTAITVAVCVPPLELRKNAYFILAISCFFFAGVGGVMSAVYMATTTHLRSRDTAWKEVMHVILAQLGSVIGGAFSTTTAFGLLGLAAASTAMNLQSVCQPPQDLLDESGRYHLVISAVFFAGVAGVMAAVIREGGRVTK